MRITDKTGKAISSLKKTANFIEFIQFIQYEYDCSVKGLMVADSERVQKLQGRTKFLDELISLVNSID